MLGIKLKYFLVLGDTILKDLTPSKIKTIPMKRLIDNS